MSEMNMHGALSPTATQSTPHVFNCFSAKITHRLRYGTPDTPMQYPTPASRDHVLPYCIMRTEWIFPTPIHTDQDGSGSPSPEGYYVPHRRHVGRKHFLWDIIHKRTGEEAFYPTNVDLSTRRPAGIFVSTLSGRALRGPTLRFRRFGCPSLHKSSRLIPCS